MHSELASTKRRHQMYYEAYNTDGWVDTPDGYWSWRLARGMLAGGLAYGA